MVNPPYRIKNMVPGMIMLWHGSVATIPSGWHLCDGTMGTPDLRDIFVLGAGGSAAPHDNGGVEFHTHTFTGDGHAHSIPPGNQIEIGPVWSDITRTTYVTGTTDLNSNMPPWWALCYIMKL